MGDPKDGDAVRYSLENHFQHLCLQLVAEVGGVVLEETLESPYEEWRGACQRRNKCIAPTGSSWGHPSGDADSNSVFNQIAKSGKE